MKAIEYPPAGALQEYIAAYWIRKTALSSGRRVYADGCADIVFNAGDVPAFFDPTAKAGAPIPMQPRCLYLGGTMTAYGVVTTAPGTLLTGIRFRPGGYYALYRMTMEPAVDRVIELADGELSALMVNEEGLATRLDEFFMAKKVRPKRTFSTIIDMVYRCGGQVSVEELSREGHVSNRTMERLFKEHVGIPPKEFIRIVRFQEVLKRLRQAGRVSEESLLRIAFELGYYDHAHLTNEFKKYAGILPSELSHFYKTGIAGGQYF